MSSKSLVAVFVFFTVTQMLILGATEPSRKSKNIPRNNDSSVDSSPTLRITGKKMEIIPRESTHIFSGDVVVEHSSFTLKASRVVSRRANTQIEASGNIIIVSKEEVLEPGATSPAYKKMISGDEAEYSSVTSTGSVRGSPAVMILQDEKNNLTRLETAHLDFSTSVAVASGSSTTLTRREFDTSLYVRALSQGLMRYSRSDKENFYIAPLQEIFIDDITKNNYTAEFKADELVYEISSGKILLIGGVKGRINFVKRKTPKQPLR